MNEQAILEILARKPELKASKQKLQQMQPGNYCIHQSWGFGKIVSYDSADAKLVIDFESKAGHRMDPGFCVNTMQVLPPDHLLVLKETEPAAIQQMISSKPVDLMIALLKQYPNGAASVAEVESVLLRVVGAAKFKKWWTATKKHLAKDPHVAVPPRKTGLYVLREEPVSIEDELVEEFNATQSAKRRVDLAEKLLDTLNEKPEIKELIPPVLHGLSVAVKESNQLKLAEKLRGAWARDGLAKVLEVDVATFEPTLAEIVSDPETLAGIVDDLPTHSQTRALELIKEAHPTDWKELTFSLLKTSSGKFTTDCVNFMLDHKLSKELKSTLLRWQIEQNLKEPVLVWIVKNRHSRKYGNLIHDMIKPRLLNAIFYAIESESLLTASSRRIPLAEFLSEDKELIPDLLAEADSETARDLANALLLNQGFEGLTKKSLLARFIKLFPGVQSLLDSQDTAEASEGLVVSRKSYEKAVAEFEDLVSKKIPENSKAIATAREHGDLKENSEYKMAKQDQQVLMGRRNMLETDLQRARISDFTEVTDSVVGIGTVVTLVNDKGKEVTYTLLGAWDGDPDNNIISYLTPLGKNLVGKKPGEDVRIKIENVETHFKIKSLARWVDLVHS